jgi:hypothetical protein
VFEQYDSTVGADTVVGPGHGPAVLRVKGTTMALVATTDGNQAVGAIDPWLGAALSVAEATRNVSITGRAPLGVTNCLNYGDPTRPEAFWQLAEGVRGLGDACRALGLPVTGGNVSLYNESPAGAIAPTPEIGVVGLLEDVATLVGPAFAETAIRSSCAARAARAWRERVRAPCRAAAEDEPAVARPRARGGAPGVRPRSRSRGARRVRAGRVGRWPRRGARRVRDLERVAAPASGCRSPTRRPSRCSARARRGSCHARPGHARRWSCSPASTAFRSRRSARSADRAA